MHGQPTGPHAGITAALGPTNTGKTHRAIERMLDHRSGMRGLPLRLLAREVYERVSARVGESRVALVTGEEKRVPRRPDYWVCTVESMPVEREVDFVAVDEIQLAVHAQRGHVFTERLLHARGVRETWFMGADTIRPVLEQLVPTADLHRHPRLSQLRGAGSLSLGALPARTAIVAFSASEVYELAERLRQRRGGAAVVLGALSPRTRNAQVALHGSDGRDRYVCASCSWTVIVRCPRNHHRLEIEAQRLCSRTRRWRSFLTHGSIVSWQPTLRLGAAPSRCSRSNPEWRCSRPACGARCGSWSRRA